MAKRFVRVSLASKFRVLFAAAVLAIIAAALAVPWYFTERLVDEASRQSAEEITRLGLAEWVQRHPLKPRPDSALAWYFTSGGEGRRGPNFLPLRPKEDAPPLDARAQQAAAAFASQPAREMIVVPAEDEEGMRVLRCFRPVRAGSGCRQCHPGTTDTAFAPDELVGIIDITMPPAPGSLIWWTRAMFVTGAGLAALIAFVLLYVITRQIILRPVRRLGELAGAVADGDLTRRVEIDTGDEFERLGRQFNEMLEAIGSQQDQLRQANRALDLRLGELAEANVSLYEANRIKNEFLANVSHELRTPLNSIIGFAELLADTDDERRRRHAGHILTSARMLLGIINDLLDLAKIEAGRAEVRIEKVSVTDLCETLAQLVRPLADKKHLRLDVRLGENVPLIRTDPGKVRQVLYNLLSNAIKFTPPDGQVSLTAGYLPAPDGAVGQGSVSLVVADTGPGIPAADQQHIFEKFQRLDSAITRETGGAGLGLAISKELTALLGGRISLDSAPGRGTTFTVVLPETPPPEPARPARPAGAEAGDR